MTAIEREKGDIDTLLRDLNFRHDELTRQIRHHEQTARQLRVRRRDLEVDIMRLKVDSERGSP